MRENRLKKALREGKLITGLFLFMPSPELVEIMGEVGFDYVIIDLEHGSFGIDSARSCVLAADAASIAPIIRVAGHDPMLIQQALDCGVQGVVVPRIRTAEEATQAVRAAKFPPIGDRGYCPMVRGGRYGKYGAGPEYTDRANEETMVILLIEDPVGVDNLDSILAVDGVDVIGPGPGDMSAAMDLVGQWNHPKVRQNVEKAITMARAQGVTAACFPTDYDYAKHWVSKGAQMLCFATDVGIFYNGCRRIKRRLHEAVGEVAVKLD